MTKFNSRCKYPLRNYYTTQGASTDYPTRRRWLAVRTSLARVRRLERGLFVPLLLPSASKSHVLRACSRALGGGGARPDHFHLQQQVLRVPSRRDGFYNSTSERQQPRECEDKRPTRQLEYGPRGWRMNRSCDSVLLCHKMGWSYV